eukprot:GHRQ01018045.1.p1 GENE.GHRQ01018045.1~~GHRQ01018045.1.p1  ORF type:complete len:191 (+),score=42.20 GHRQ01018045.1:1381-1953(+)
MPPYDGLKFNALRSGTGFNFTGQLLGVGGKQLQRIKQESAARLQVNNAEGNLNGSHPDPLDPNLHALIAADSLSKLQKAAMMVCELLAPVNSKFLPIDVVPGGSARLTVVQHGKAAAPKPAVQVGACPGCANRLGCLYVLVLLLSSCKPGCPASRFLHFVTCISKCTVIHDWCFRSQVVLKDTPVVMLVV